MINITKQTHTLRSDDGTARISVSASGPGTLSYTWKKDGKAITAKRYPNCKGVDTDTLSISPFSSLYEGSYSCVITTEGGQSVESEVTKLLGTEGMYTNAMYHKL